jgi:di/tricarboxylate transporter
VIKENDQIIVATTRKNLTNIVAKYSGFLDSILTQMPKGKGKNTDSGDARNFTLAEIMVAPASAMAGRNLEQIGFHYQSGCFVLGVQRRSRMIRGAATEIPLEAGDVLLIIGRRDDVLRLRNSRNVVLLEWSASSLPLKTYPQRCMWIFFAVVALAASRILPIAIAATAGAALMIAVGCLNVRQAARAIDRRVMLLVGASLAMGIALERSGGAAYLAREMINLLADASTPVVLSGFFFLVAAFTNVLSNNAAAILFTPIAIKLANQLGTDPRVFAIAVILAANCSFATPMSYQTNLLIMGPGHYRFTDFMRLGIPLTLILWIVFSIFAPYYYGLH